MSLLSIATIDAIAQEVTVGDLIYTIQGDTSIVKAPVDKNLTEVVIPSSVEYEGTTYPVTEIGKEAFSWCEGLVSAILPGSIRVIDASAFSSCKKLSSLVIPEGVRYIGSMAFAWCYQLTSFRIPASVIVLDRTPFYNCYGLLSIDVDTANPAYCSVDGVLFDKSRTTLLAYPGAKKGAYTIPEGVKVVAEKAFFDCDGVTSVIFPNSVDSIGNGVFDSCSDLTSVQLPASLKRLSDDLFYGSRLKSITIPENVTYIGRRALGATFLTRVFLPAKTTEIADDAFRECLKMLFYEVDPNNPVYSSVDGVLFDKLHTNLLVFPAGREGSYNIPDGTVILSGDAFGYSKLEQVIIPASVDSIGSILFGYNSKVANIYCKAVMPPKIKYNRLFDYNTVGYEQVILHVPLGYKAVYEATDGWKQFANIVEEDFTPIDVARINEDAVRYVDGMLSLPASATIRVYTLDGKCVWTYEASEGICSLPSLPHGAYIIRIQMGGKATVLKISR